MKVKFTFLKVGVLSAILLATHPGATFAQHYMQKNLVSDIMGMAPTHDSNW